MCGKRDGWRKEIAELIRGARGPGKGGRVWWNTVMESVRCTWQAKRGGSNWNNGTSQGWLACGHRHCLLWVSDTLSGQPSAARQEGNGASHVRSDKHVPNREAFQVTTGNNGVGGEEKGDSGVSLTAERGNSQWNMNSDTSFTKRILMTFQSLCG